MVFAVFSDGRTVTGAAQSYEVLPGTSQTDGARLRLHRDNDTTYTSAALDAVS